jgi:hypothetical protein
MHLRFAVRLSLFLAVLAVPADALGAPAVRTFSVSGRLVAPTGHPSTLSLACPPGAVALNAAVTRQGGGVTVRRSIPGKGSGDWAFRVAAQGSGSRAVSGVLRCVALRLPEGFTSAHLGLSSRNSSNLVLSPGETTTTRLGCGRAWTATGYALEAGRLGAVRLAKAIPGPHGWIFTLENTGSAAARGGVAVRCLRSTATARRPDGATREIAFRVSRPSLATVFDAGPSRRTSTATCGRSRFSLSAGISVDPADQVEVLGASPAGPGGARWVFGGVREGDGYVRYTVCLSTATRFH